MFIAFMVPPPPPRPERFAASWTWWESLKINALLAVIGFALKAKLSTDAGHVVYGIVMLLCLLAWLPVLMPYCPVLVRQDDLTRLKND